MSAHGLLPLPTSALTDLADELRRTGHVTDSALGQIAGALAQGARASLTALKQAGMTPEQTALLIDAVVAARAQTPMVSEIVDLVVSGPDLPGVPVRDTLAALFELVQSAKCEVWLAGYAIHHAGPAFQRLAERMAAHPKLKVTLVADISRGWTNTSLDSEVVAGFAHDFRTKQWPWEPKPMVYFDPRSLSKDHTKRSAMHAKCVIVDRQAAFITSANFTEAAQERNIEVGVLVRHAPIAERLVKWFEGLVESGGLVGIAL
jgi:hypothetical protein